MAVADQHILRQLRLPDRFERLSETLGPEVTRVLVAPEKATIDSLLAASLGVKQRGEGLFLPCFGDTGTGKTTLALCAQTFLPNEFGPAVVHSGAVTFDSLHETALTLLSQLPENDGRVITINIDHREGQPPEEAELAAIKRFLRTPGSGARVILFWPETSQTRSKEMAKRYVDIVGPAAIPLPLAVRGPAPETWRDITRNTLLIVNSIDNLADLGVDPNAYDPHAFKSLGLFMRSISNDFNKRLVDLINATRLPTTLVVVFVSESPAAGVLERLCSSTHYGLLDPNALLAATPESELGRWWTLRRGLLVQAVYGLNAHAFCLPPTPSVSCLRQFGSSATKKELLDLRLPAPGPVSLRSTLEKADLFRFLAGERQTTAEDRGSPGGTSLAAFQLLAERGFNLGKDKSLNKSMSEAIDMFLQDGTAALDRVSAEQAVDHLTQLVPDNAAYFATGTTDAHVVCVEYTWRKGDFLSSSNKSSTASYVLEKLRNYSRTLGWTAD
jgi:energy-coupling factor transporter ATP-binding protein EcfA2